MRKETKIPINLILALLVMALTFIISSFVSDFYFDLNDDVLMKDILSGAYTGDPESRNIQMLYLISAFISIPYRIIRALDWYGIFLCFCQIGCIFLLVYRSLSFAKSFYGKVIVLVTEMAVILGLMF
nr:hypothetical protein [Butyrivibrio sp.]